MNYNFTGHPITCRNNISSLPDFQISGYVYSADNRSR